MVKAMKLQNMLQRRRNNLFLKDKPYRMRYLRFQDGMPGFGPKHHGKTTVVDPYARKLQKKRSRTNRSFKTKPYKRHHV